MISLFIRNLIFTVLQPGLVAGLIPLWISGYQLNTLFEDVWQVQQYIGASIFVIGFVIMIWCIINFAVKGRGTLSPIDPTKKLVLSGLYKFSRNPMYVGVMLLLIGEAIFLGSTMLWIYVVFVFILFNIFVIYIEEPRLKKDFGKEYISYTQNVRRWI
ncbi:MAG: isoprenylcysteine carboxylmethyltransferase family protein [Flavobacteriaceae bacterium]|nr:isoprenylcysteine carboxylmethyltransferase family protein [Flavobacteriaceae bacterium]